MGLTRDNHFVPRFYLKNFANTSGEVYEYRVLVPHPSVHLWKPVNVAGTGYEKNLYTRIVRGQEADDIEQWLNHDFETPAKEPLQKVLADQELTGSDWKVLSRFLASQIVRTPAFLVRNLPRWKHMTAEAVQHTFKEVDARVQEAKASGRQMETSIAVPHTEYIPIRVDRKELPAEKKVQLTGTILVGRGLWFFSMKHMLSSTLKALYRHKWSILEAPARLPWFTSDDPVICMNFNSESNYDFEGGWGRRGGNILFPLSPRHLMFTEIGAGAFPRKVPSGYHARFFRRIVAEHAHRRIYSLTEDKKIPILKPRVVDAGAYQHDRDLWQSWYEDQSRAEANL